MSIVTLVSGGIDSSVMALLAKKEGIIQYPLFIDYGQRAREKELCACRDIHAAHDLPKPVVITLSGFGEIISSGLTDKNKDIFADSFLPGRNLLFLLAGAAYAYQVHASAVSIGLLNEEIHLFPDQTAQFLTQAEAMLSLCMERNIRVITPLMKFYKSDVIGLAKKYRLTGTYSCHSGLDEPCGVCVSCKEILSAQRKEE